MNETKTPEASAEQPLPAPEGALPEVERLKIELAAMTGDRDHWKANHDNQVKLKAAVLDRPDLKERATLVQQLIREVEGLKEELAYVRSLTGLTSASPAAPPDRSD